MYSLPSFYFSFRTIVIGTLIFFACTLLLAYVLLQARFLLIGPQLTLLNEPALVQKDKVVRLQGTASNIAKISLNGRQIFTDTDGYFDEALVLENGYTIATIEATDRYGRKTDLVRQFVYTSMSIIPQ